VLNDIDKLARIFKLLSDANRLKIIFALENESRSVSQIIESTGLSQPLVSFHLKILREAGVVMTHRQGTFAFNTLCDKALPVLIRQFGKYEIAGLAESNTEFSFPCPPCLKR
jgi:DNA-binding transcriptional ArsR family regulator